MAKISAIMPTYNRVAFLPDAINSILEQTYKDWELIVVDDGSTDTTPEFMEWVCRHDSRVKYIQRKKNLGIAITRNEAVEATTTDRIIICDSDDVQVRQRFEKVMDYWKHKPSVDIVYHRMFVCNENLTIVGNIDNEPLDIDRLLKEQYIAQPTLAYKKSVWKKIPYNPEAKYGEDWEWLIRCAIEGLKFGSFKTPLVKYREHQSQERLSKVNFTKSYDEKMVAKYKKIWEAQKAKKS